MGRILKGGGAGGGGGGAPWLWGEKVDLACLKLVVWLCKELFEGCECVCVREGGGVGEWGSMGLLHLFLLEEGEDGGGLGFEEERRREKREEGLGM
jgi:hypothetical protein